MKCIKCYTEKEEEKFPLRSGTNRRRGECIECRDIRVKKWIKEHPENRKIVLEKFSIKHHRKNCVTCGERYKPVGIETACSIKCKLLSKIEKKDNGCWIWKGCRGGNYGKLTQDRKIIGAHRASYLAFKGPIEKGKVICHSCDDPFCINPDHLWIGTQKENMQDAKKKGRTLRGEKNHRHNLTDEQVKEIRKLKDMGFTYNRLRKIFNCSVPHLFNIIKKKSRT